MHPDDSFESFNPSFIRSRHSSLSFGSFVDNFGEDLVLSRESRDPDMAWEEHGDNHGASSAATSVASDLENPFIIRKTGDIEIIPAGRVLAAFSSMESISTVCQSIRAQ